MPEPALTDAERRRSLAAAICCTAVAGIAMGLTWPLLALVLQGQGVSGSLIGLSSATQSFAVFLVAPMAPRIIVRFGLVRTVLTCIMATLTTLLLLPLFPDVHAWFPIRLALGASTMLLFIATETWVNQVAPETSRGRVIGLFGLLWSAGFASGPMIIGLTGTQGWPPFLAGSALVALAALPLLWVRGLAPSVARHSVRRVWHFLRLAPAAVLAAPVLGAADYVLDSFLPVYGLHHGLDQTAAVTLLTTLLIGVTAAQYPAGWLADHIDRRHLLCGATAVAIVACLALPVVIGRLHPLLLLAVVALLGAALGSIWTIAVVLLGQKFQGGDLVAAYAVTGMLHGIGMVIGPLAAGAAVDLWGAIAIPFGVALCCLLYLPFTLAGDSGRR